MSKHLLASWQNRPLPVTPNSKQAQNDYIGPRWVSPAKRSRTPPVSAISQKRLYSSHRNDESVTEDRPRSLSPLKASKNVESTQSTISSKWPHTKEVNHRMTRKKMLQSQDMLKSQISTLPGGNQQDTRAPKRRPQRSSTPTFSSLDIIPRRNIRVNSQLATSVEKEQQFGHQRPFQRKQNIFLSQSLTSTQLHKLTSFNDFPDAQYRQTKRPRPEYLRDLTASTNRLW